MAVYKEKSWVLWHICRSKMYDIQGIKDESREMGVHHSVVRVAGVHIFCEVRDIIDGTVYWVKDVYCKTQSNH